MINVEQNSTRNSLHRKHIFAQNLCSNMDWGWLWSLATLDTALATPMMA